MKEKRELILEILIETRPSEIREFTTNLGKVKMIPFGGTVDCEKFHGIVEPFGVDTQITGQTDVRHMSARYMLTGTDYTGKECHIYIENNGYFTNGEQPKPFYTVPTFLTDSKALAPLLHQNKFIGEGKRDEKGLWIRFYAV